MQKKRLVVSDAGEVVRRKPQVRDLRWNGTSWQRWTGRRWAKPVFSLRLPMLRDPAGLHAHAPAEQEQRQQALRLAVEEQVVANAARVVHEGPGGVVLGYRRRVAHVVHALLTILTGGLWGVVWLVLVLDRRDDRVQLEVDRWGHVWAHRVAAA